MGKHNYVFPQLFFVCVVILIVQHGGTQECTIGTFGVNCAHNCSDGCKQQNCTSLDGSCSEGCIPGTSGQNCDQLCENGTWGEDCKERCPGNCVDNTCDNLDGSCLCTDGRRQCSNKCKIGTFGVMCTQNCSDGCKKNNCNSTDGSCLDGCMLGKSGNHCDQLCENGTWGDDCKERCPSNCVNNTCDNLDGSCLCTDGRRSCSNKCKIGTFGRNCSQICSDGCKERNCNSLDGSCLEGCIPGTSGQNCDQHETNIVGISVFTILIVMFLAGIGLMVFFQSRKRKALSSFKMKLINKSESPASCVSPSASFYTETTNPEFNIETETETETELGSTHDDKGGITNTSVAVDQFIVYLEKKKQQPKLSAFKEEHSNLPSGIQAATLAGSQKENASKNRYRNIVPYDHCRVHLKRSEENSSDYINASYIDGYDKKRAYVACQGPTFNMTEDFWRMIWELHSCRIVMLTNLVESDKKKCDQYWPESGDIIFGDIAVKMVSCETFPQYTIRTFRIKAIQSKRWRVIKHFHYMSWPDCKAPRCAQAMVHFGEKVIAYKCSGKGPMVVHCSAGVGRTGTFIALDYLLRQARSSGYVDVFNCVKSLRMSRPNMVQTLAQYVFLHDALAEGLNLSSAKIIPVFKYQTVYRDLLDIDPIQKKQNIQLMFEFLQANTVYPPDTEFAVGKMNKDKNRYHNILPVGTYMPVLENSYEDRNNYINAVYFRSYNMDKAFIITQMPLQDTIIDFWRLVYERKLGCIVMVNEMDDSEKSQLYWPVREETETYFGTFKIRRIAEETRDDYSITTLGCTYNDVEHFVKLFRSRFWPEEHDIPESPKRMLRLVVHSLQCQRESGNKPMLVHCMDGAQRSGLFCVVTAVIDRMKTDQNITIPCFIRDLRRRRPQIIPTLTQFQFCYDAVSCYLQQIDEFPSYDLENSPCNGIECGTSYDA